MRWRTRYATCVRRCAARRLGSARPCCPSTCRSTATTLRACAFARRTDTSLPSTTTETRRRSESPCLPPASGIASGRKVFASWLYGAVYPQAKRIRRDELRRRLTARLAVRARGSVATRTTRVARRQRSRCQVNLSYKDKYIRCNLSFVGNYK